MKKRVSAVVIVLVCLGGVACIKTLSTSSVGLPQLAFDNIEALASGESSAYRCYGIGDVDCHGDNIINRNKYINLLQWFTRSSLPSVYNFS